MTKSEVAQEHLRLQAFTFDMLLEIWRWYGMEKAEKVVNILRNEEIITGNTAKSLLNKLILRASNEAQVSGLLHKCNATLDEVLNDVQNKGDGILQGGN